MFLNVLILFDYFLFLYFFFFNDTATTELYTLSLHDALPIWWPTTTTVSRPFSGSQARTICSTNVRPPARCNTFARLDFSRVPLPAARITLVRSLLDMVCAHSAGGATISQRRVVGEAANG